MQIPGVELGQSEGRQKVLEKNRFWRIAKNLKNVIWYSSYESIKTGKRNTFLVSFIIPVSLP